MKLKINGINYDLNFGLGAFELLAIRKGITPDEATEKMLFEPGVLYNELVFCSVHNGLKMQDEFAELPFNYYEFLNFIGEEPQEINLKIQECYLNTTRHGKTWREHYGIDLPEQKESKKKPIKKRVQPK